MVTRPSRLRCWIGSGPYREGMARFAHGIHEHLPPAIVEHRMEALEEHFDSRLSEIEAKINEILRLLDKGSSSSEPGDG